MNGVLHKAGSTVARVLGLGCVLMLMWLGLPFASGRPLELEEANSWLLTGTLLAVAVSFGYAVAETSLRDAALFLVLGITITWAVEAGGVRWGFPFGWPYSYHEALRPRLWGGVPLFIPLAWYVLLRVPAVLLRRWDTWREIPTGRRDGRRVLGKAGVCGLFMGGCSLMLEPLGVSLGTWVWSQPGIYFGFPVLNTFGWALVGFVVHAVHLAFEERRPQGRSSRLLYLECELLGVTLLFHGLAFVAIGNRLHSWLPAVSAVMAMAPLWVYWVLSIRRTADREPRAEPNP